jgi:hypothetical protein
MKSDSLCAPIYREGDAIGTLNYIITDEIVAAARLIKKGKVFALGIPIGSNGPQVKRGFLLDVARYRDVDWLEDCYGISNGKLDTFAEARSVEISIGVQLCPRIGVQFCTPNNTGRSAG